jgi:hypothetical protein
MPAIIRNTPACLIPKELFKEEKTQEYWNVLYPHQENMQKEDLDNYFLIYPKPKEADSTHDISSMYKEIRKKYPNQENSICINVFDEMFNIIALKENSIIYAGNFCFSEKEDILYHLTNISQQFFENISVTFFYQQLSTPVLRLLNKYYEMKKL